MGLQSRTFKLSPFTVLNLPTTLRRLSYRFHHLHNHRSPSFLARALSSSATAAVVPQPSTSVSQDENKVVKATQWKAAIDFKWIKDNKEAVAANIKNRYSNANLELVLELYDKLLSVQKEVERLRSERNAVANKMKAKLEPSERQKLIEEGKSLKDGLATLEEDLLKLTEELQQEAQCVPNMTHPDVPVGGEDCSAVRKVVGKPREFDFAIKDHVQLGKDLDILDFDSASELNAAKQMLSKVPTDLPSHLNVKFIKKYLNLGDVARARQLFDGISEPDVQSWTLLISAYTKNGRSRDAIKLYSEVKNSGKISPDKFVILAVAKACAFLGDSMKAKEIHFDALKYKICSDLLVGNALIDMYGKCKCFEGGRRVFGDLRTKDVITWTSFCSCCVNSGFPSAALETLRDMVLSGVRPNAITLSSVIPACSHLKCLNLGREIHGYALKNGMGENHFVNSALVGMYSSCSSIKQAESVFKNIPQPDVVLWNVIISAYFSNGESEKALNTFQQMRTRGVKLDNVTWNSVVSGCADNGKAREALELLGEMQLLGFKPNQITITSALTACSVLESWRGGKEIHAYITRHCYMEDLAATTALVLIYAKGGDLENSNKLFSMMPCRDTVAWNTIIIANSMHGRGEEAISLFNEMVSAGVKPNSVTFTGVLSGCSHSQMVDEGLSIFHSMTKDHRVESDAEHYSCMVDVLSRGGRLTEAYNFIHKMPVEPRAAAWGALLGACRIYKNVELSRIAAHRLFEMEPDNPGNYVLLFNILVTAKQWGEASEVRRLMRDRGIRKAPGCSWIRVNNRVHTFVVGDKSNDKSRDIYKFLDEVRLKMKSAGFYPNTEYVLQDLDGEEREDSLCNHSEKLAVAFGILNLRGESSIKVFKNLRICGDCHNTINFIAKIVGIQIIVRDSLRFHHFKEGQCSCRDFW